MSNDLEERWPYLSGRMEMRDGERVHVRPIRVYFEDTDAGGVTYHASYVRWCERGRTDFLRLIGTDARGMITGDGGHEPAAFVVRKMNMDFLTPTRMDELLEVETRVLELGGASATLRQSIFRGDRKVFEADVVVVLVSVAGKPMRLTDAVRAGFQGSA
ncbi:MAG: YbgC/FadM family acyl-CoA thioesterase, partial [Pseudomonadota bacterium]